MSTLLFRTIASNPRNHPISLGLLYAWCPAAAYWWRVGVEVEPPFDPVWQAVEDYTAQPPRTLRQYLEDRGLANLLDDARRYIEQVTAARQRLPHVRAPELLPTFPGGKLPLRKRFGIREALEDIGGAEGFFAYVRTWAFLVPDWLASMPYAGARLEVIWVAVRFEGLRSAYRLPVWAVYTAPPENGHRNTPVALGVPPGRGDIAPTSFYLWGHAALAALYLLAQSEGKSAWEHAPQVWQFSLDGTAAPVDPTVPAGDTGAALLTIGAHAAAVRNPLPLASLVNPERCRHCVFRSMCFDESAHAWTPQAAAFIGAGKKVTT